MFRKKEIILLFEKALLTNTHTYTYTCIHKLSYLNRLRVFNVYKIFYEMIYGTLKITY